MAGVPLLQLLLSHYIMIMCDTKKTDISKSGKERERNRHISHEIAGNSIVSISGNGEGVCRRELFILSAQMVQPCYAIIIIFDRFFPAMDGAGTMAFMHILHQQMRSERVKKIEQ